jgi:O-antigen ligase
MEYRSSAHWRATREWVLAIDADEVLTPELQREIGEMLDSDPREIAYCLPWAVTIFGKRLDYGRSARAPLRLFRREGARFSDCIVHEKVLLPKGKVGRMSGRLLHYTHRDFGETLYKNANYAWLGAQKRHAAGKTGGGLFGAALRGIAVFFQVYILRGGILDGGVGFLMAVMYSQVAFNKYAGLWTLNRKDYMAARGEKEEK